MRRLGTASAAVVAVLALLGLVQGAGAAPVPVVAPGGHVRVAASGFAPSTAVTLRIAGSARVQVVHADEQGRVSARVTAPSRPGRYRLDVVGAPPLRRHPTGTGPAGSARRDPQGVQVVVPRLVVIALIVRIHRSGGSGSGGSGTGGAGTGGIGAGGSGAAGAGAGGSPAHTGADVLGLAALATLLLALGGATVVSARRRTRHPS